MKSATTLVLQNSKLIVLFELCHHQQTYSHFHKV